MCADLNSVLLKITDKYLENDTKTPKNGNSGWKVSAFTFRRFYQLVNDLLDQTTHYMMENNIHDTTAFTELVQSELERFIRTATEN